MPEQVRLDEMIRHRLGVFRRTPRSFEQNVANLSQIAWFKQRHDEPFSG
jgi:hypothetical protein